MKYLTLAAGGAIGTLLRYAVSGYAYNLLVGVFPWGTLAVNLIGSLLIGFLWGLFEIQNISPEVRTFIFIGILGGFTTFSTFTLESLNLFREGEARLALINIIASNVLGIALVFTGLAMSKALMNLFR